MKKQCIAADRRINAATEPASVPALRRLVALKTRPTAIYPAFAFVALAALALSSCSASSSDNEASGTFESAEIIVSAEGSGRIVSFPSREGSELKAGSEVARIDSVQLELRRKQLEAQVRGAESRKPDVEVQLAAIAQQLDTARAERARVEKLLKADAASSKQLDDIDAQIATLERQLAAQRESLAASREGIGDDQAALGFQIEQLDDQIARCAVKSPIDGTLLVKYAEEGELAVPGKALFRVADMKRLYLRAYVSASELTTVKLGSTATVRADFGEKQTRTYDGTVTWISEKSEFTPKNLQTRDERSNLVYAVKIAVENDGYLKLGMYGRVRFSHE